MAEDKSSTMKVNLEIQLDNLDEEQRQKLTDMGSEADMTNIVRSLLEQADDMPMYTKTIWGQWQEFAA